MIFFTAVSEFLKETTNKGSKNWNIELGSG